MSRPRMPRVSKRKVGICALDVCRARYIADSAGRIGRVFELREIGP